MIKLFLVIIVFFVGCGDNILSPNDSRLIGTWDLTAITNFWGSISNPDSISDSIYSIGAGRFTRRWTVEATTDTLMEGFSLPPFNNRTWSTDGDQLIIFHKFDNVERLTIYTYSADNNHLIVISELDRTDRFGDWEVQDFLKNEDPS